MVGWFGAAALALVGGLKGQGNPWRQVPLVGVLAATALFISWRVRQGREKDNPKSANVDDKTVVEVNTRVYLVYDEEKKLGSSTSPSQSQPDAPEGGKFDGTDDLVSTELEVDFTADDSSKRSQRAKCKSENRAGEERLPKRRNVSKAEVNCKDVEEISKAEATRHGGRPSAYEPSPTPESKITDISVSGFLLPQMTSQTLFMPPEIASIVEKGESYVYELGADSLKAVTEDSVSYSPLSELMHHEKDIIPVSDVASTGTPKDEHSTLGVSNGDFKQRTFGPMERLEKVIQVVDGDYASEGTSVESGSGLHENENGIVDTSSKIRDSPEVLPHSASSRSSTLTHVLPGVRKGVAPSDRSSSTFREVRATWISPELQLNDWVSRRGDSEIEDGRLAHPSSAAETYPSPVADSIPGAFPFSCYSASESCSSDAIDTKDELLLRSPPSNVKRINPHVKDLEPNSKKSSEEEYAERLRIYDEYLADPSLSPRMRSQVSRAKTTLERLLYDSD